MDQQLHLPILPPHQQRLFEETVERVRMIASRLKDERLGRYTVTAAGGGSQAGGQPHLLATAAAVAPPRPRQTVEVTVPLPRASLVVGPQGETLKRLEKMTGCRIQLDQSFLPHPTDRRFLVTGLPEDIEEARRLISDRPLSFSDQPTVNIAIPQVRIGLVIGRGGETIREIQEKSGAKVIIAPDLAGPQDGRRDVDRERIISLMGEEAAIATARDMIEEIVFGMAKSGASRCLETIRNKALMQIPEAAVGAVIGKRAETLRGIQQVSGARVFVDPGNLPGTTLRNVHISGDAEAMALAQQLVVEKVRQVDPTYGQVYDQGYGQGDYSSLATAVAIPPSLGPSGSDMMAAQAASQYQSQQLGYYAADGQAVMDPAVFAAWCAQFYASDPAGYALWYTQYMAAAAADPSNPHHQQQQQQQQQTPAVSEQPRDGPENQ